jgi:hypothetical protein
MGRIDRLFEDENEDEDDPQSESCVREPPISH